MPKMDLGFGHYFLLKWDSLRLDNTAKAYSYMKKERKTESI